MNSGPLARFFCSEVSQSPRKASRLPRAFKSTSISMLGLLVALHTTTVAALDLPFDEAIRFFEQKTSVPTRSHRDVWDAAHSKMFMVAGANSKALVDDFKGAIGKALEQGTTLDEFRKDFDATVKKFGWSYNGERGWRTRTIFETNLRTAYAAGRYAQLTEPETLKTHPWWQYHHSDAIHPRLQHKAWDGTVLPADDSFWSVAYPPNGYGCGCFVVPISRARLRGMGKAGPDASPNLDQLGADQPLGVDPSFAYNPGAAWLKQTAPGPVAVSADEANVAAFVTSAIRGRRLDGSWTPVAVVDKRLAATLDVAAGTEIRLVAEEIRARGLDDDVTPAAYAVIPRRLAAIGRIKRRRDGGFMIEDEKGDRWKANLAIVRDGDRAHVRISKLRRGGRS